MKKAEGKLSKTSIMPTPVHKSICKGDHAAAAVNLTAAYTQ